MSPAHEQSFVNELNFYQRLSCAVPKIILPFQIIEIEQCAEQPILPQLLVLPHSQKLFELNPQNLSQPQIQNVLLSSLCALEQLHGQGYIHGDLKPAHFRRYQDHVVMIDFEQMFERGSPTPQLNTATPHYMAPELFHAEQKSVVSDIYALGIIWLEWLNQQKLQQSSYLEWAKLHCQQLKIEMLPQFKNFETVLSMMLQKNKQLRCTNFYQIKQRLNNNVY